MSEESINYKMLSAFAFNFILCPYMLSTFAFAFAFNLRPYIQDCEIRNTQSSTLGGAIAQFGTSRLEVKPGIVRPHHPRARLFVALHAFGHFHHMHRNCMVIHQFTQNNVDDKA